MQKKNRNSTKTRKMRPNSNTHPPQHPSAVTVNHTFRYRCTTATAANVTLQTILAALGSVGTVVTTNLTDIADSFRINSLRIWSPATSGAKIQIAWAANGANFQRPTVITDVCTSVSEPAHIFTKPPKNELYADWLSAQSTAANITLFTLKCDVDSIVDFNVTYQLWCGSTDTTQSVYTIASGVAAVGTLYYVSLDGANNFYRNVDMSTTS
jgi:hypothetical protein